MAFPTRANTEPFMYVSSVCVCVCASVGQTRDSCPKVRWFKNRLVMSQKMRTAQKSQIPVILIVKLKTICGILLHTRLIQPV